MSEENGGMILPVRVVADTTDVDRGLDRVEAGAREMAKAVQQAGASAGAGLSNGIVESVKRATTATAEAAQSVMTWTQFLKQNMGPAMKAAMDGGSTHAEAHTAAIRKIAEQWRAYKDTVQSVGAAFANASAAAAQSTTAASASADKLTASQARLLATLEREAVMLTQGRAAWREHQASMLGVGDAASAYISKIKAAEQGHAALGLSAKQTSAALRQVPMQFQDIIVSLQAGQAPLTVLLQQGSQLSTVFGGVGPAARAFAGYMMAMVNPVTIGAAALGGLAFAAHAGNEELREFQNAAALTGNAIGVSSSKFSELRDSIAGIAGTKGKAAEVLTEIARNGQLAGANIKGIAEAAILMEKATGQAVSKTIGQFAELAKSPTDAARKLNEEYNFLTTSIYAQIKALEDQGQKQKAAELASKSLADVTKERASAIVENVGFIEGAWNGVLGVLKRVIDATKDIGRTQDTAQQLALVQGELRSARGQDPNRRSRLPWEASESELVAQERRLLRMLEIQNGSAAAAQAAAEANRAGIAAYDAASKTAEQYADKQTKLNKALKEYHDNLKTLRAIPESERTKEISAQLDAKAIARTEAGLRKSILGDAKSPKIAANAFDTQALREYTQALDAFNSIAGAAAAKSDDLSKTQAKLHELQASPVWASYSRQQQEQVIFAASLAQAEEDRAAATKLGEQAIKDATQAMIAGEQARSQQVQAAEQAAAAAQREYEQYGLLKSQVQQLTLAKLEEARASAALAGEDVSDIEKRIAAQKRLIAAQQGVERKDIAKKEAEEAKKEWERTSDGINQSLTDALMRGFESGKGFGKNLRDTLKNMFETLVLRPIIKAQLDPLMQQMGMGGNPFNGSGPLMSMQNGSSGNMLGNLGSMFGGSELMGSLGSGMAAAMPMLGVSMMAGEAMGLKGDQKMVGAAAGALIGTFLGGPLGAIAGAALGSLVKPGGGPKGDGWFGVGVEQGGDNSLLSSIKPVVDAYQAQFDQINALLGGTNSAKFGLRVSRDPKGDAPSFVSSGAFVNGQFVRQTIDTNVGRDDASVQAAIDRQMKEALIEALKHTNLPAELGRVLSEVTVEEMDKVIARVQKALSEKVTLEARAFALTHTDVERLADARAKERAAIDETNRALFDHVTKLEDLTLAANAATLAVDGARNVLLDAYQRESQELRSLVERHTNYAQQLRSVRDSLTLSDSPMTATQRRARTGAAFDGGVISAVANNEQALQDLGGLGRDFIEATKAAARSPAEVAAAVAKVQAGLTIAAAASEGRASTAQQQIDAMTEQLSALGVLNTSVLTVGDALAKYLDAINKQSAAQSAIQQAQLDYAAAQAAQTSTTPPPTVATTPAPTATSLPADFASSLQSLISAGYTYETGGGESGPNIAVGQFSTVDQVAQAASGLLASLSPEQRAIAMLEISSSLDRYRTLGHFAGGGYASGLAAVGERGMEIVDFDTPGRVYTNEQTRGMFASNAELLPALNEVCAELKALRQDARVSDTATVLNLQKLESTIRKWERDGMPLERTA
jgi:hypothetical protein